MKIEISILELLARRAPDLVREIPLRNQLEIEQGEAISLADLKLKLRDLETSADILCVTNKDAGAKWTITDQGKARLARARE